MTQSIPQTLPAAQPSDVGFKIVSAWLQQEGTAARGDQLYTMNRFADFVLANAPKPKSFSKLYEENAQGIEIERLKLRIEELEAVQMALNKDEIQALLDVLDTEHDGSEFEAECPACTAYRKLTAMLSQPPAGQQDRGEAIPKKWKTALLAAWNALAEMSPCMAKDCNQPQVEAHEFALKAINEVLAEIRAIGPSTKGVDHG